MCGLIPRVAIDAAWPDVALDRVAELLHAVRCPVLGRNQPAIPLAFTQNGRAVSVRWECGELAARPITPDLFAIDIVMHVCRPVRLSAKWRYEWHDDSVLRRRGLPCAFPLGFARAFLASGRIECLPMLTDHRTTWRSAAQLIVEWNLFADRIVEMPVPTTAPVPVSTEMAVPISTTAPVPVSTEVATPVSAEVVVPVSTGMPVRVSTEMVPVSTKMAVPVPTKMAAPVSTEMSMPVSTEMAAQPADAPQLTLPPLPRGHS